MKSPEIECNDLNGEDLLANTVVGTKQVEAFNEKADFIALHQDVGAEDRASFIVRDIERLWDSWFINGISDFVRVPNLSELFDDEFKTNGLI